MPWSARSSPPRGIRGPRHAEGGPSPSRRAGRTKSWSYFYHREGRNRRLGLGRYPVVYAFHAPGSARPRHSAGSRGRSGPTPPRRSRSSEARRPSGNWRTLFLASQHFATRAESTKKELRRIVEVELRPEWGHRRLSSDRAPRDPELGRSHRLRGSGLHGEPLPGVHAARLALGPGARRPLRPPSPFYKLPKPFLGEAPRDRVLSHEEIRKVFEAIGREPRITAAWWVMLFLTAARDKSEVLRMEKREIDRDRKVWIVPREKTKPKRTLVLPLVIVGAPSDRRGDSALRAVPRSSSRAPREIGR